MNGSKFFRSCLVLLTSSLASPAITTDAGTCCVWRATNTKAPCYLVGSIHALSGNDYPLPQPYYQALHDSKRILFEMYVDPKSENEYAHKFVRAAAYPKGDDVRRHVHPKTAQILQVNFTNASLWGREAKFGDSYLDYGMLQLRPWAIAAIFYGVPGYSDIHDYFGVDNYFSREAKRSGKERAGLETIDEHIEVLRGMNDLESELMLVETIVFRDKEKADFNQSRAAWKCGGFATLAAVYRRFWDLNPRASARLIDERNRKWVPKIEAEFRSGKPTSIVVGALHMLSPTGLLALLERQGFKFEQL
ncbi:MAG TPA: TraB/GumN family protein [Chthoniobacterales bacterium]|jgi:hypothetical protein|nr:TraB/GumN family protein [Chthoniobacterales bacterium]